MTVIPIKPTDNIFFLDDDWNRIRRFMDMLDAIGFDRSHLWVAENVEIAAIFFKDDLPPEPFNIYFFDHDLLPDHYDDLSASANNPKGTGQEVASMIKPIVEA